MIQRLAWAIAILTLGGCGVLGGNKKEMKDNQVINSQGGGVAIDIVDNVNNELWRLHPALHYLKSEVSLAHLQGFNQDGDSALRADAALFLQEMEGEYMSYEPSISVIK